MGVVYSEHEKLLLLKDKLQTVGEFIEWLQGKYTLCTYHPAIYKRSGNDYQLFEDEDARYPLHAPVTVNTTDLLEEFFEISRKKLDEEKEKMVDEIKRVK